MSWFKELLLGGGVAHSILILAMAIAAGVALGKIKFRGISLGVTWILFVGIAMAHFGMRVEDHILHIFKEFGLILFVYSIGLQVGPGFFSSFRKGGVRLNLLATTVVLLGVATTLVIHLSTGIPLPTMVGIMSGAVTNTPGLGAAQQANMDITGISDPDIATGYAIAYPLAVVGIIGTILVLRYVFGINLREEERQAMASNDVRESTARKLSLRVTNPSLDGMKVGEIRDLIGRNFVISRMRMTDGTVKMVNAETVLHTGDQVLVITSQAAIPVIAAFIGEKIDVQWEQLTDRFLSRHILITKPELNGKTISQLRMRSFGASITRVNRSGIDLVAWSGLQLQMGDRVTVVGTQQSIAAVGKTLGNSLRKLDHPNIFHIFVGIALGVILGSIPFIFPGIPQPVKLGLAGGPLIVAILISRFGPKYKLVTHTTASANLMLREVGIALFLACVGLGAGETFIGTIADGGYKWIGYGAMITLVPLLVVGVIGRRFCKLNYFTLSGLLAGSMTDPPALAYSNDMAGNDIPAVGYATVYPLTMFLRVLCAQLMILMLA
ncbi:putative transporter [Bacteroidia bacterium]|nr:putative transporter [Bacteroidia bacterium]